MRPVRLTMQAFGPYAQRQELNMADLGETGLYAITGETGAGKTTIFDAIVYALYGSGSGEDRSDGKDFRSAAADPGLETRVELEFVSGGKVYRVERSPRQFITGKRKDKLVEQKPTQTLILPDGTRHTGRDVDDLIAKDILGVTREQFCQIVMIAQGEFRKLLQAETKQRTEILRQIFKTKRFDALSRRMDELCKEKYRQWQSAREQACFALRALRAETGSALFQALEAMQESEAKVFSLEDAADLAQRLALADEDACRGALALLERAARARDAAKSALERAADQVKKRQERDRLAGEMERRAEELRSAEQALRAAEAQKPDIERLAREIAVEERALPQYAKLEGLIRQRDEAEAESKKRERDKNGAEERMSGLRDRKHDLEREAEALRDASERLLEASRALNEVQNQARKLNGLNARVEALESAQTRLRERADALAGAQRQADAAGERRDALSRELEALGNTELALSRWTASQEGLMTEAEALEKLGALLKSHQSAVDAQRRARESFIQGEREACQSRDRAVELRRAYNANLAGIWAAALKDGAPCPVCGSIHHPHRASLAGEAVTEEAVKRAEEAAANAERSFNEQARVCAERKAACDALREQLEAQLPGVCEDAWEAALEARQADNARARQAAEADIGAARRADARRRRIEDTEMALARAEADRATGAARNAEAALSAARSDHETAQREVDTAAKGVMPEGWTLLDLSDALSENAGAEKRWREQAERARRDRERLDAVGAELRDAESALQAAGEAAKAASVAISGLSAQLEGCDRQLAALREELPHPTRGACERSIARKRDERSALEAGIEKARELAQALKNTIAGLEGQIRTLEAELKDLPPMDLDGAQAEYGAKEKAWRAAADLEKSALARKENNARQIENLLERTREARGLEAEYRVMKDVSDTANGNVTGEDRITLETYVQTAYFDRIIRYANRRLIHMSRQQYELARQNAEEGDKRAKTGLGLDVVDHANGTRRAVSTLSGGEGFLASLSLALGMSDAIQASATSAVQLDAMFVDEGFGSLSDRFLGLVLDELNDTANSGHRLIGVISHVEEVKEGMERRIEVTKSETGVSRAVIR